MDEITRIVAELITDISIRRARSRELRVATSHDHDLAPADAVWLVRVCEPEPMRCCPARGRERCLVDRRDPQRVEAALARWSVQRLVHDMQRKRSAIDGEVEMVRDLAQPIANEPVCVRSDRVTLRERGDLSLVQHVVDPHPSG